MLYCIYSFETWEHVSLYIQFVGKTQIIILSIFAIDLIYSSIKTVKIKPNKCNTNTDKKTQPSSTSYKFNYCMFLSCVSCLWQLNMIGEMFVSKETRSPVNLSWKLVVKSIIIIFSKTKFLNVLQNICSYQDYNL